jgi:O-antigen ligase
MWITRALVSGPATGAALALQNVPLPRVQARPGRLKLWRAATEMIREHPLQGIGPDNFRLLYGPYAGLANPDPRVHSNNMYLEILVGGGLLAAIPFAWLCWRVAALQLSTLRRASSGDAATAASVVAAATVAIAVHGLVDSFFSFTATYVLFAITLGLAVACGRLAPDHAHRV